MTGSSSARVAVTAPAAENFFSPSSRAHVLTEGMFSAALYIFNKSIDAAKRRDFYGEERYGDGRRDSCLKLTSKHF